MGAVRIERLKRRRDFLRTARGRRQARDAFSLESARRDDEGPARIGFTVTKRTAVKAVERNRIRRRLKEVVRLLPSHCAAAGADYVVVGRRAALTESFAALSAELAATLVAAQGSSGRQARDGRRGPRGQNR